MEKKTVLQIVPSLISGGIERGVLEINDYLVKHDFNSIVLSSGGKLTYQIKQDGGKNVLLDVNTKNPIKIWKNIGKIKKIIIENKVDLVHVRSRAPAWSAYFACKALKCPLVSTIHGNYSNWSKPFTFFKKLYNSSIVKADWIICVSNYIKDYAYNNFKEFKTKLANNRVKVIHRGVDVNLFNPNNISQERIVTLIRKMQLPDDKLIILLPGRLTEWKGQLYFMDVLSKVKNKNFVCVVLGDSKGHEGYRNKLKARIKKLKLDGVVKLEDNISDMAAGYMVADIVVSSSIRGEAFGRVVPEAQAMKRMVIATSIGGSLETIIDKKTGWLVDPKDKNKFAEIIDYVLSIPVEDRLKIGEIAREHIVKNYTTEIMCKKTIDLYNEILSKNIKN